MAKVSVAGSKRYQRDVIETFHELNLVHLSDYDGGIEGFDNGDPLSGADGASEKLVTVRSLQSILGVTEADAGTARIVTEDAIEAELEDIRVEVNEFDDKRTELESKLQSVEDDIEAADPFVDLGIDLDLLGGYETIDVVVGTGTADAVRDALDDAEPVGEFEVFEGDEAVGIFARTHENGALADALVGVEFTSVEIPDASGDPEEYVASLESNRQQLESKLETVENELEDLRLEHGEFLLAAEEKLAIDVQKTEIPLQFATTEHAFVAEGWVPVEQEEDVRAALRSEVGDHVDVDRIEIADYEPDGHHEPHDENPAEAATDGGQVFDQDDSPPVVQDNPGPVKPFEALTQVINRPKYTEIDPTFILFLTFPLFYGFMIGDLGYGILYAAIGYWLYQNFEGAISDLGQVAVLAGISTAVFGVLYGEIFGFHLVTEYLWVGALGMEHAPIKKGLHSAEFAELWLTLSLVAAFVHLGIGYVFGYINDSRAHGVKEGFLENLAPLMIMVGTALWLFSTHLQGQSGPRPVFLYEVAQLSPTVGLVGLAVAVVGVVGFVMGEGAVGAIETPTVALVNAVSYTRLAAVLLAKAGMAFVVNLLAFGAYEHGHEVHFMLGGYHVPSGAHEVFPGLIWQGPAGLVGGILVLFLGHAVVLALGVTSAGLQAVRLEYVEFFGKFYEGGGEKYNPFGHQRNYTTED